MRTTLAGLLALTVPLAAQDDLSYFRADVGLAGGRFHYRTDNDSRVDRADAALFRVQVEGTGSRGFGGGARFEGLFTDDYLVDAQNQRGSTDNGTLFLHMTYRFEEHRFAMPFRAGLLVNRLGLGDNGDGYDTTYLSVGPKLELAPELVLLRRRSAQWTLYGELGFGVGGTWIDFSDTNTTFHSSTGFAGIEVGTRVRLRAFELGLAYVGRWQSMAESDDRGGLFAQGYGTSFNGLLLTMGIVF